MTAIRYVRETDKLFWFRLDEHISEAEFQKKVRDKMGYVILNGNLPVGLLRYNLFWDSIPFCTMLYVDPIFQHNGYGKKLMEFWEAEMKAMGYRMLMTSTRVDEQAQNFYRNSGYQDSGGLLITVPGYEQPMELFLVKAIK